MNLKTEKLDKIKQKYKLTNKQFDEMYENCKYISFYNCEPQEKPIGVFVGGQTGAGKGGIDVFSEKELLRVFSTDWSQKLASEILIRERKEDKNSFIEERQERFKKLLSILKPKDEFEENQIEKLKKQINERG